jgi:hypothetical protein
MRRLGANQSRGRGRFLKSVFRGLVSRNRRRGIMLTEFPRAPKLPRLFPRFVRSTALARPEFGLVASYESPADRSETLAGGVVRF